MSVQEEFEKAAQEVKELASEPSNEDKLILYGLFKQATIGNCNIDKPGYFNLKDKAKWDAWNAKKGTSKEDAQKDYIKKVAQLIESIGKK
ncbi:GSCOCG00002079001-RA-CDS [Cotesia congregata]|uniref:Similar to Acyl-CoA-binding protein (Gossypium hirsutum) n=1 Tax=Cotesia congregata TaxID=51543 RepID=A0A8J2HU54_COTCN|nr:GSCOCG00002079001-RA-CDS [Cotesia congregata]CAG5108997.1 Similar to Acyl-CoA-binding protein (Gossypium hirsutum) [Cotesia congregata]